jgi:hypothetical protein
MRGQKRRLYYAQAFFLPRERLVNYRQARLCDGEFIAPFVQLWATPAAMYWVAGRLDRFVSNPERCKRQWIGLGTSWWTQPHAW